MAAEFKQLCEEVRKAVRGRAKGPGNARFVINGTAEEVLHDEKLAECFQILAPHCSVDITESTFVQRINERKLHNFLAIILHGHLSSSAAQLFVQELVASDSWPVKWDDGPNIGELPANLKQLEALFDTDDAETFLESQPIFCVGVVGETKFLDTRFMRRPYLREKELGAGAYGRVFEVEVAERHFKVPGHERQYYTNSQVIARKDYIVDAGFDPREERRIMAQIARKRHDNILTNYGSMRVKVEDTVTFSLFMPKADFDLRKYMMDETPPTTFEGKEKLIACARGLAQGLHFLHHEMETAEGERLICYHMDLKPANILIFCGNGGQMIWKLSDFGMASVKIERPGGQQARERGFTSWFRRNGHAAYDPSVSDTRNPRGDGTYLAPESVGKNPEMNRASDVWALGCVLSVFFTYLEEGSSGIEEYSERRAVPAAGGMDRFFLKEGGMTSKAREHLAVKQWHGILAKRAAARNEQEGQVLKSVLEAIDAKVIKIDKASRCKAGDVADDLKKCQEGYKKLRDVPPGPDGLMPVLSRQPTLIDRVKQLAHKSQKARPYDEYCYLKTGESFSDGTISNDGNSAAFWVGKSICYCSQGFIWEKKKELNPVVYHLDASDEWNSVSLTRQYLVASTTNNKFECFIINLKAQDPIYHHIILNEPKIHQLAISELEDGTLELVCLLGPVEQPGEQPGPGSMLYVPLSDLIASTPSKPLEKVMHRYIRRTSFLSSEPQPEPTVKGLPRPDDNVWSASDVAQMHVPRETEVHLVVKSQNTETPVTVIYLPGRFLEDTSEPVSFRLDKASSFTTMAPLRDDPGFAYITYGKQYGREYYASDVSDTSFRGKTLPGFSICQLIAGRENDELFAIGKEEGRETIWLLKISLLDTKSKARVEPLGSFPKLSGQHFTARLPQVGSEAGKFILVASITPDGQGRQIIYRANLPPLAINGGR